MKRKSLKPRWRIAEAGSVALPAPLSSLDSRGKRLSQKSRLSESTRIDSRLNKPTTYDKETETVCRLAEKASRSHIVASGLDCFSDFAPSHHLQRNRFGQLK